MKEIQRCSRCIMDNSSDPTIVFDEQGVCNYCTEQLDNIGKLYFPNEEGEKRLAAMLKTLKEEGRNKEYDCLMGISGGLDSSYLACLGFRWGLRILAVHIDDGYDTDISKSNIEKLCRAAHINLKTIRPDARQYSDLLHAYMKAGVPNLAIPQDNILFAFLYDELRDSGVRHFLLGGNFALECILQKGNSFSAMDTVNIRDINRRFGANRINRLRFISSYRKYWYAKTRRTIDMRPLNYIDYNRKRALAELKEFCGFAYYGRKHLENELTAFIQLYWLPRKFGVDKRTSHLSSMIVSGQMTRKEALQELGEPLYDEKMMDACTHHIKSNLGITEEEFAALMAAPTHQHEDYRTDRLSVIIRKILH